MLSLRLTPRASKRCLWLLISLHAALFGMVWVQAFAHAGLWTLCILLSMGISFWQWQRSAMYCLELNIDGSACLQWRQQPPVNVVRCGGGMTSKGLLVAVWQDAQKRRYQTVLWPDSVNQKEFKMAYVWLRWQSVPKEESKQ